MKPGAFEVNFDGLVGPTHNYAGLSEGNLASMAHRQAVSNPRQAALQGLAKMKFLADLGIKQAVLPPHERPHIPTLRRLGCGGTDGQVLASVASKDPLMLASVSSASAMWAANAATVSPSADTRDNKVHFTPANLITHLHRSIEPPTTARILRAIFADERHFTHHDPLPAALTFADEGAANHTRLAQSIDHHGVELFTFGSTSKRFPARQSLHASRAIANMHGLKHALFVQQNPDAIDAGAFHNDVVAVGHGNLLLYHESAWLNAGECIQRIKALVPDLRVVEVKETQVSLADAIATYIFNSQLVTQPDGSISLIAPLESRDNPGVTVLIARLLQDRIIGSVHYVDVRQSMQNGGGPACLRLRVVLDEDQLRAINQGVILTDALHARLKSWLEKHYREELSSHDLADPQLLTESRDALDELSQILALGPIYEFQR